MNTLDPRIKRLGLNANDKQETNTNSHLITYEVFHQEKRGKHATHVGIVHASTPDMALVMAKEVFGRRGKTTSIWVVKTSEVYTFTAEDEDMFETTVEKTFRDPAFYKVRDRIEAFRLKNPDIVQQSK